MKWFYLLDVIYDVTHVENFYFINNNNNTVCEVAYDIYHLSTLHDKEYYISVANWNMQKALTTLLVGLLYGF